MKPSLLCYLVVIGLAPPLLTYAEETPAPSIITSDFGFTVQLSKGWVLLGPSQSSQQVFSKSSENLGITRVNQAILKEYIQRVKSEKVEFYLDTQLSTDDFTNNVSVQLQQGSQDYSQYSSTDINTACEQLKPELEKVWSTPVEVKACGVLPSHGTSVLAYSYIVPNQDKFIVQYEIPFGSSLTAVVVGGGRLDREVVSRVREAAKAIVVGTTGRAK